MPKHVKRIENEDLRHALQSALEAGAFALADGVRAIRALHGLSQVELAEQVGLSVNAIKSIESGRGNPEYASLAKLADLVGLRVALVRAPYEAALLDPEKRRAEEKQMRAGDQAAIDSGAVSERELDRRNAMQFEGVGFELPELV